MPPSVISTSAVISISEPVNGFPSGQSIVVALIFFGRIVQVPFSLVPV